MGTLRINGVTVFAEHVETIEDGVSDEYLEWWEGYINRPLNTPWESKTEADHPAVVVTLASGRVFRIAGAVRQHLEHDVLVARRRG